MENDTKAYLTIKEMAQNLSVHENTIRRMIIKGRLSFFRLGGGKKAGYRIPASEVHRLAEVDLGKLIDEIVEKQLKERLEKKDG